MYDVTVGERARAAETIEVEGLDMIEAGEQGEIVRIDPVTGEVDIRMDRYHPGLLNNCLWLIPGVSDDEGIVDRLEVITPAGTRRLRSRASPTKAMGIVSDIVLTPVEVLIAAE
jgi:hypothetical protein